MKTLLKNAREQKGLKTREVAQLLDIDQALISKFESGTRKPTKDQIQKLASLLDINFETLMIAWLKEKIIWEIGDEEFALKALKAAEAELLSRKEAVSKIISSQLEKLVLEIDQLKAKLKQSLPFNSFLIDKKLELNYNFESNHIEGNTLTFDEMRAVLDQGLTITGKTMREHLELINHQEAINHIKHLKQINSDINERELLAIHSLLLRGIPAETAGQWRPDANVKKNMDTFFHWYESHKKSVHPVILAAKSHSYLHQIQPFTIQNGCIARLFLNWILLQNGYCIANIKGDPENLKLYRNALESTNKEDFIQYIIQIQKESILDYMKLIG